MVEGENEIQDHEGILLPEQDDLPDLLRALVLGVAAECDWPAALSGTRSITVVNEDGDVIVTVPFEDIGALSGDPPVLSLSPFQHELTTNSC